jgi:hypothetical protein
MCADLQNQREAVIIAFAADVAAHASLRRLSLDEAPLDSAAALDAVVDAALARRLQSVTFWRCRLFRASAPTLARLLQGDALTTLKLDLSVMHLDAPSAAALAAALRANSTLTSLSLSSTRLYNDAAAAAELLGAFHSHASLQLLSLECNFVRDADRATIGASLGALVAANAPALTHFDVGWCNLGDDGLRALLEALPHNTHLRELLCLQNDISHMFWRDVLRPAVRANTSLRKLEASTYHVSLAAIEELVSRRAAA